MKNKVDALKELGAKVCNTTVDDIKGNDISTVIDSITELYEPAAGGSGSKGYTGRGIEDIEIATEDSKIVFTFKMDDNTVITRSADIPDLQG